MGLRCCCCCCRRCRAEEEKDLVAGCVCDKTVGSVVVVVVVAQLGSIGATDCSAARTERSLCGNDVVLNAVVDNAACEQVVAADEPSSVRARRDAILES